MVLDADETPPKPGKAVVGDGGLFRQLRVERRLEDRTQHEQPGHERPEGRGHGRASVNCNSSVWARSLIGIGYDSLFTGEPGIIPIIHSIEYVARLVGVEHVALGSDYDGVIKAPFDASGLPLITQGLKEENFSADEIQKIMGGNVMRFLTQNLP